MRTSTSIKLKGLDIICVVLDCEVGDLLISEPETVSRPARRNPEPAAPDVPGTGTPLIPRQPAVRSFPWTDPLARHPNAERPD
ncbi:hypothetical protein ACMATS_03425 [Streptoverticillium reticulum]|uniref:hypothetical protein n=1 Tax=Streptoverticillium reticulum TaxID=1433415 RepID=UPI0039BFF429